MKNLLKKLILNKLNKYIKNYLNNQNFILHEKKFLID